MTFRISDGAFVARHSAETLRVRHRLDPESERIALYVRLTSVLRGRIESGEWEEGHRIPSIEELCDEYGVARNTVRQALQLLRSDGLIDGGRGVGTFVLKRPAGRIANADLKDAISDPLHLGPDQSIEILSRTRNVQMPDALRGERNVHASYTKVRKLHRFRGRPFALMDIYIASQIYARFPGKRDEIYGAYKDWYNRHERIIDDFDNRFAALVKRASKDQGDYQKNYGKYQAEVLQLREESKKALLADKAKLTQQCNEFPAYVRHPKSDIPAMFPVEFKTIYRPR